MFMKIICCIKQVPEIAEVRIDKETGELKLDAASKILNPFDEFAIEESIKIKESRGGEVVLVSMGPPEAKDAILKALAMGADSAIHLTDPAFQGADSWATASTLAAQISKMEYDLIFCGKQATDWDAGQVGSQLAEILDIPQVSGVRHLEIGEDGTHIIAHRATDDGYEVIKANIPVLLTATKGLNEPRLPNIMGIMKAKKKPLETIDAATLDVDENSIGEKGAFVKLRKVYPPEKRKGGIKLEAEDPKAVAKQVVEFLAKKGAI
jgi:electron transfer flavoprotein beta subunit